MNQPQNQNGLNLSPQQLDLLLKKAGQQLGRSPEQLKQQLNNGQYQNALKNLSPQQSAKLNQMLSSPAAIDTLLQSPQVKNLLRQLSGGK